MASSFRSACLRRALYLVTPAASSMIDRRSSGLALTMRPIRPCSMIEYARVPTPVPRNSSVMSSSRHGALLISYSLVPSRNSRRVTVISAKPAYCGGTRRPSFWKAMETSAIPVGGRDSLPLKMTSSIERPRRCFALCSPMAQRMASTTLLLPQPFGPTTPVTPSSKEKTTRSANDLKPEMSTRRIFISQGSEPRNMRALQEPKTLHHGAHGAHGVGFRKNNSVCSVCSVV